MYGTKSLSYVKVKCWVESEDFHSPGSVTFIKGDGGMAVCFILFFAVNPIYAICSGAYAGKDIKIFWPLPIITALFFLLGTWLFFSIGEKAFILYAFGYLLLGIVAELISMFVKKKILRG